MLVINKDKTHRDIFMYAKMTRAEWLKYGDKRLDALKSAIQSGDPVSSVDGKNIVFVSNRDNLKAIDEFIDNKNPIFVLKTKTNKTVPSNQIGKSPLFGGKGKGAGATGVTAKGEALQCLYLAAMLGESHNEEFSYFTSETLKKYAKAIDTDKSFEEMMSAEAEWHYSAYVTGKYLIEKGFVQKDHVLHRGSKTMNTIYKMKRNAFKADGKPALNDDKWNPGDIWAVRKGVDVTKVLTDVSVGSLNASLKKAYDKRDIVGISLKQINTLKANAKHTEYNLKKSELAKYTYKQSILKSDRRGSTFWTLKGGFIEFSAGKMDVRAPSSLGAMNVEIQGKGARGGRTGYASIQYAAKAFLGKTLPDNNYFKEQSKAMLNGKNERMSKEFWKKVNAIHSDVKWDDFWIEMQSQEVDRIHANLAATEIIYCLYKSSTSKRNDFVSYLVNLAGSKTNDSSVYVKVERA